VLRYSGSPLRYSFSERGHSKSVTLVDVPAAGPVRLNQQDLVQPRDMAEIAGSLDELLTADSLAAHVDGWVRVTVTDRSRPDQMFDRIKSRFPHVLQVFHLPAGAVEVGRSASEPAAERSPRTLAADFVRHVTGLEADGAELEAFEQAYREALADVGRL
jgi:exonuclease SbcD